MVRWTSSRLCQACREHAHGQAFRFVFLGDYIDRGPDFAEFLRLMMSLQADLPKQIIALKGNHEAWAVSLLDGYDAGDALAAQRRSRDTAELRCERHRRFAPRASQLDVFAAIVFR